MKIGVEAAGKSAEASLKVSASDADYNKLPDSIVKA
jgi:hypothetical protein